MLYACKGHQTVVAIWGKFFTFDKKRKVVSRKGPEKPVVRKFLYGIIDERGRLWPTSHLLKSVQLSYEDDVNFQPTTPLTDSSFSLQHFLQAFNDHLVDCSGELGLLTNTCIFCGHPLSDADALKLGYGKICQKKFGLDGSVVEKNSIEVGHTGRVRNMFSVDELGEQPISEAAKRYMQIIERGVDYDSDDDKPLSALLLNK
jgi:hypothetical protein